MARVRVRVAGRRPSRLAVRLLAAALVLAALAGGAWLWLRDSSLAAVRRVSISGVSGPDAGQIRAALTTAARSMTTLDVRLGVLHTAVAPFPVVRALRVTVEFPHLMRIHVTEQIPVALVGAAGGQAEVAADGTLLRGITAGMQLPTITTAVSPGGTHVTGAALWEVRLLAAAPTALLRHVQQASSDPVHGLVATLRNGPTLYFGASTQLGAKWAAAAAVLADSGAQGASYIDVTAPSRPAAGTGHDGAAGGASGGH